MVRKEIGDINWLICEVCGKPVMLVDIEKHIERERREGIRDDEN